MLITGRNFLRIFDSYNGKGSSQYVVKFWDRETGNCSGYQVGIHQNAMGDHDQPKEFVKTPQQAVYMLKSMNLQLHAYGVEVDISGASAEAFEEAVLPAPAPKADRSLRSNFKGESK